MVPGIDRKFFLARKFFFFEQSKLVYSISQFVVIFECLLEPFILQKYLDHYELWKAKFNFTDLVTVFWLLWLVPQAIICRLTINQTNPFLKSGISFNLILRWFLRYCTCLLYSDSNIKTFFLMWILNNEYLQVYLLLYMLYGSQDVIRCLYLISEYVSIDS